MTRRELLKYASLSVGYTLTASLAASILGGCKATPGIAFKPEFLTPDMAELVAAFAERLLPKTETPGAIEAGVPQYIDTVIGKFMKPEERKEFETALAAFATAIKEQHESSFQALSAAEQDAAITLMAKTQDPLPFSLFRKMKDMSLTGYATSQLGATKHLTHVAIPGRYQGCISIAEAGGKQFAPN